MSTQELELQPLYAQSAVAPSTGDSPAPSVREATPAAVNVEAIPQELKDTARWVVWNYEVRGGKRAKVPLQADSGELADITDPAVFKSFELAERECKENKCSGIGFVFIDPDPIMGVDLDHCVNDDGSIQSWAKSILDRLNSYSEFSPSGTGIKIFLKGSLAGCKGNKKTGLGEDGAGAVEFYESRRYFTVTGRHVAGMPAALEDRDRELKEVHAEYFASPSVAGMEATAEVQEPVAGVGFRGSDEQLLASIRASKQQEKFNKLWGGDVSLYSGDQSRADMALCSILSFWCGPDPARIDQLFRQSRLHRAKWDEMRGSQTYGQRTIQAVLKDRKEYYTPANAVPGDVEENLTDMGNGYRFARQHRGKVCYCPASESWKIWDGKRWAPDLLKEVDRLAKETVKSIYVEAGAENNERKRKEIAEFAKYSESERSLAAMIKLAKCELSVAEDAFDSDPWLLNVKNGTLDLKSGKLLPHSPGDMISKLAPVDYEPAMPTPVWDDVLDRILGGDVKLKGFLQRLIGYFLTGVVSEEVLPIFFGEGANGKTTLVNTILEMMGEYAGPAPQNLLMIRRSGELPPNDLAALKGRRFMSASESDADSRLSEGLVKQLTGRERLKGRLLYQNYSDFVPVHKIVLQTNHKPTITGTDVGIWRRILLVPFTVMIPVKERDRNLPDKLNKELPGILAWAVQGCLEWQKNGLNPPAIVLNATNEYAEESNSFKRFVEECCVLGAETETPVCEIKQAYVGYCTEMMMPNRISDREIATILKELKCTQTRNATRRVWRGIVIRPHPTRVQVQADPFVGRYTERHAV